MSNSELAAFNEDLNRHMAAEVSADKMAEWVERKVDDLMAGEYSPFNPDNVTEALSELCLADQILLSSYIKMCHDKPMNLDTHTHLADFMVDRVNDYWHEAATSKARDLYFKGLL